MELTISIEDLRKHSIFIATPMYGGQANGLYVKSILDLQAMFFQYGIQCRYSFLFNESLIPRARNYLCDEYLRSGFSHLLFLDSDIEFNPEDVLALVALNKDVIGAPYVKKSVNWGNVAKALIANPAVNPGELEKCMGEYVFNPVPGTQSFQITEPLEVMEIGTGFMLVKKEVFDVYREAYPEKSYKPDHVGQPNFDGSRYIHAYFDTEIDTDVNAIKVLSKKLGISEETVLSFFPDTMRDQAKALTPRSDRYLSEDYMFCQRWRKLGGQVWICPWMRTKHVGSFPFIGDMGAIANMTGSL
jgi:hypothetical protein